MNIQNKREVINTKNNRMEYKSYKDQALHFSLTIMGQEVRDVSRDTQMYCDKVGFLVSKLLLSPLPSASPPSVYPICNISFKKIPNPYGA